MTDTSCEKATPVLVPMLSDRWVLGWRHVLVCVWFGLFFMYLNYMPIFHSDIWGHVHYGQWMMEHRQMVDEDPYMPLAAGMHSVNNAWLAQIIFAQLYAMGGAHFLSHTFALLGLATYLFYFRTFFLVSGRVLPALLGTILALTVGWTRHAIIRPENFGVLAAAVLFWMLVHAEPWRSRSQAWGGDPDSREESRCPTWFWFAIPVLFLFWANAHGSFAVGLIILACHAAGRILEVAWQTRSVLAVLRDPWVRAWTLLTELAVMASLMNPYGVDLLIETATFGRNPNLKDILEWYSLRLMDVEGMQFMLSIVIMLVVVRHSQLRFRAVDVLLLFSFAALTAPTIRMIGWYAPVFAFVMMPHVTNIWLRVFPASVKPVEPPAIAESGATPQEATPMKFVFTLICALIVYVSFALSPLSQLVLGGKLRRPDQVYSRMTPLGVSQYLREHPINAMIFTPQWWGDWVALDGGPNTKVFMTTHVHLAPSQVWKDYMRIQGAQTGWERTLERYKVRTVIVDKERQIDLMRALRGNEQWQIVYEDQIGVIANRVNPAS